jgi:hypothetical protein
MPASNNVATERTLMWASSGNSPNETAAFGIFTCIICSCVVSTGAVWIWYTTNLALRANQRKLPIYKGLKDFSDLVRRFGTGAIGYAKSNSDGFLTFPAVAVFL